MSKCKKIDKLMVNGLYDELQGKKKKNFLHHLKSCPGCREKYQELTGLMKIMDKRQQPRMSEDFWDNYYPALQEKINTLEQEQTQTQEGGPAPVIKIRRPLIRWALYPAAAMALLVVGIVIGQYLALDPGKNIPGSSPLISRQVNPAVAEHFYNLQPLLIDYANYTPSEYPLGPGENDMVTIEKRTVQKLLLENRLLKRIAARDKNIPLKRLMDELELILLEISHSSGGDSAGGRVVQQLIKDNDILFKITVFSKQQRKISTL